MVDGDGDTVLHLYCKDTSHRFSLPFLVPALRLEMCQRLLGFGISPRVRNKDRLLPIDCVDEKESSLREVLRVAMFTGQCDLSLTALCVSGWGSFEGGIATDVLNPLESGTIRVCRFT